MSAITLHYLDSLFPPISLLIPQRIVLILCFQNIPLIIIYVHTYISHALC